MNRTTWMAVTITVVVLVGASFASRLSGRALVEQSRVVATGAAGAVDWGAETLGAVPRIWSALPHPARAASAAGAAALLTLGWMVSRHRSHPRRLAVRMLRRGGAPTRVARRTRLSRDAIRMIAPRPAPSRTRSTDARR